MRSRRAAIKLSLGTALAMVAVPASSQARPRKIGWLKIQDSQHTPGQLKAFLDGLRAAGEVDGRSFVVVSRFADGDSRRLGALSEDLLRAGCDIIVATSQPALDAARRVTNSVPIVARMTDDPVQAGVASSLSRPGGNVTGVYSLLEEMSAKRLALLQQAVPSLRRVGALLTLHRGATAHWLAETEIAARHLGIAIHVMNVQSAADLDGAFARAAEAGVNGLVNFRNPTVVTNDRRVVALSDRHRIPGIFEARDYVDAGGFMSYGPNLETIFGRLAGHVSQIIRGARPGELPIEQPTRFELVLNLKAARAMELIVPAAAMVAADEVIE